MKLQHFATKLQHFLKERFLRQRDLRMLEDGDINGFWDTAHKRNAHLWLTGSDPSEVVTRLDVESIITSCGTSSDALILDVGLGEGRMAKYLNSLKVPHDGLDISSTAVANVSQFLSRGFTSATDLPEKSYKLVMHHLVAQHMSHAALQLQLRSLVGSLTDDGVIALQYSATGSLEMAENDDEQHQKMGAVWRNPSWFNDTAESINAEIVRDLETDSFGDIRFRVVWIRRIRDPKVF